MNWRQNDSRGLAHAQTGAGWRRAAPEKHPPYPAVQRRYDLRILANGGHGATSGAASPPGPVTTLRGASVGVDVRVVGRIALGACLAALAFAVVILFVAGVHNNDQITKLRSHGVPVEVTVAGCRGLIGGSGSNLAGYACTGTFTLGGRRYGEQIPGSTFYAPGTKLEALTVPSDPALLSTKSALAEEHASSRVFILPGVLLFVLVAAAGGLVLRARSKAAAEEPSPATWQGGVAR